MIEIIPNWHPIFVHFTVALLFVAVALYPLSYLLPATTVRDEFTIVARWYAYNSVAHNDVPHAAMTEHRNGALTTLVLFIFLAVWSFDRWWKKHTFNKGVAGVFFLIVLATGGVLLASTAWHGAELVYRPAWA